MKHWKNTTLGEVITLQRGFDLPSYQRKSGDVPIVSSSGISGFHSEAKVKAPGVVTGRYGTIGQVYYIEQDFFPLNTTLYVKDFKGNDEKYVSYLLRTINFKAYSDKSSVPGVNRNNLHTEKVLIPPIDEQKAIAKILSSLDDKIQLNRQMNVTLEAMARAVFNAWFVDFESVRANMENRLSESASPEIAKLFPSEFENGIPKGWQEKSLDEIAHFLNGLALQRFPPENHDEFLPVIKIAQLRKGNTEGSDKASKNLNRDYIVQDGDVLFSWSGSLEVEIWCGGEGALNQHLFKVTSKNYPKWFYYLWTKHYLSSFRDIAAHKATTMGHIQRYHLREAKVLVPNSTLLKEMNKIFEPIIERFILNLIENRNLLQIRNELLPKLLSGQIPVAEIRES